MIRVNRRLSREFASTALVVLGYAVAMGYLEAAVVVYLRAALGTVAPGLPAAHDQVVVANYAAVEGAREFATLVMIAAVGWLAGRSGLERLAWAAVVFGAWDITYYVGLYVVIGWPASLTTWDVLFLLPSPWVGPVWAPIAVSAALIGFGLAAARALRAGHRVVVGPGGMLVALAGGGLVVVSFLVDAPRFQAGDLSPWTGWPIFCAGMALGAIVALRVLSRGSDPAVPDSGQQPVEGGSAAT